jgi:hypothetical protein
MKKGNQMTKYSWLLMLLLGLPPGLQAAGKTGPPPDAQPVPDGAPAAKDIEEPQITIRNRGTHREEEYRLHGKLYMVKVTPPKGRPYYLIDNTGDGKFVRYEGPAVPLVVPMWLIKTF